MHEMMSGNWIPVCDGEALKEGGKGVRFPLRAGGERTTGFVVRYRGQVYAYLNRCAHVPVELDWNEGIFFESGGDYLACSTHGALYQPETGLCKLGPCRGRSLRPLNIREEAGQIFWQPDDYVTPAGA